MSELKIKSEVRKIIRMSSLKVDPKMVCSIVKLFNMRYSGVNNSDIASITRKLINEY